MLIKEGNKIILELVVDIPPHESWIYENPEVISSINKGLKEAGEGRVAERPSFAEFADDILL